MQLYFNLNLSIHSAASINRARAQIVIAREIIACAEQKIWDSMPFRRLYIRLVSLAERTAPEVLEEPASIKTMT
jgi:hypothetical protein